VRVTETILTSYTRQNEDARVDQGLVQQVQEEKRYYFNVLSRVVAVIKFLAHPFRGDNELLGSAHNGHFFTSVCFSFSRKVYMLCLVVL